MASICETERKHKNKIAKLMKVESKKKKRNANVPGTKTRTQQNKPDQETKTEQKHNETKKNSCTPTANVHIYYVHPSIISYILRTVKKKGVDFAPAEGVYAIVFVFSARFFSTTVKGKGC